MIALLVFGAGFLAALACMQVEKRRDGRVIDECVREDDARREEREFQRQADVVLAIAESILRQAEFERSLRHLGDLAEKHPMPKRPASPAPAPGEPWQLRHKNDTLDPRLVEQGESDD